MIQVNPNTLAKMHTLLQMQFTHCPKCSLYTAQNAHTAPNAHTTPNAVHTPARMQEEATKL